MYGSVSLKTEFKKEIQILLRTESTLRTCNFEYIVTFLLSFKEVTFKMKNLKLKKF